MTSTSAPVAMPLYADVRAPPSHNSLAPRSLLFISFKPVFDNFNARENHQGSNSKIELLGSSLQQPAVHLRVHIVLARLHLAQDEGLGECNSRLYPSRQVGHLRGSKGVWGGEDLVSEE